MKQIRQYELVERIREYNPETNEALINKAYVFAMRAHGNQKRANGDPYFSHPIEVAAILTALKLDDVSIITALLHDTIEDTDVTREEIAVEFGEETAALVDGVTKLTKLELAEIKENLSENEKQAENFRKLLLAIAEDIRVLLIKLADRLHNMRTLHYIRKQEKRERIALETLELYAPLAGRIGVQFIREELEDLAFRELNPSARNSVVTRLEELNKRNPNLIGQIESFLSEKLKKQNLDAQVTGRIKNPYSIYQKMKKQDLDFEQLADVIGFRILLPTETDCYRALGVVHQNAACVPGRFKDYISTPKRNGYRSIHTTVMMKNYKAEVQLRTPEMHSLAERGVAAHWNYKEGGTIDPRKQLWVTELLGYLKEGESVQELLEYTKMEIYHDRVFCFSPKGRIIRLPKGAGPVDFAYAVHSDIGDRCIGVKINGVRAPLRTELQNGDTVEILCGETPRPSPAWESFAVTAKAKSAVRRHNKQKEREQYILLGESLLKQAFGVRGLIYTEGAAENICKEKQFEHTEALFYAIGKAFENADELTRIFFPDPNAETGAERKTLKDNFKNKGVLPISGLVPGVAIHLGRCCLPLPGDRIIGLLKETGGAEVHTIECEAPALYEDRPEIWLDLCWDAPAQTEGQSRYLTRLNVDIADKPGALGTVAGLIGHNEGNITNIHVIEEKEDFYSFGIELEVYDVCHLQKIINLLKISPVTAKIDRECVPSK